MFRLIFIVLSSTDNIFNDTTLLLLKMFVYLNWHLRLALRLNTLPRVVFKNFTVVAEALFLINTPSFGLRKANIFINENLTVTNDIAYNSRKLIYNTCSNVKNGKPLKGLHNVFPDLNFGLENSGYDVKQSNRGGTSFQANE